MNIGDVYRFSWNDKYRPSQDAYWCFDGQFVVVDGGGRGLLLRDTYWGSMSDSKTWTPEVARERGELTFVCNMSEVQEINERESKYYDSADIFDLSYQHRCYKRICKRKDAVRSKAAMLALCQKEIDEAESEMRIATGRIQQLKERQKAIEQSADLSNEWV